MRKATATSRLENLIDASAPSAESLRMLRLALDLRSDGDATKIVLFTSAEPEEGKSTIAANYALVSSLSKPGVLLVDADLHRPRLHEFFGLRRVPGLIEALAADNPSTANAQRASFNGDLDVLTAGQPITRSGELVASRRMANLLEQAKLDYRLVVIDSPPVLVGADAAGIVVHPGVEVALVVKRTTKRRTVMRALRELRLVEANVTGVVVNREGRPATYHYRY